MKLKKILFTDYLGFMALNKTLGLTQPNILTIFFTQVNILTVSFTQSNIWPYPSILARNMFGTRQHFDFLVIIEYDTLNDNMVITGCKISKQSLCANYSATVAWIVR